MLSAFIAQARPSSNLGYILLTAIFFSSLSEAQTYPPVPANYQDVATLLANQISSFDTAVRQNWNGSPYPVTYAPQLLAASSDLFTQLLGANYYANTVTPQLQELQALGAQGVTVHVNFPILYQPFYLNQSDFQSYVRFYQQLVQDVHARGMKLIVESATAVPLVGAPAQQFMAYYPTLSWNDYMNGRTQNVVNVVQLIQPDYLSAIYEPDTEAASSMQPNAGTIAGSTQLLQTILAGIQNAGGTSVPIGAGAGTWLNNSYRNPLSGFIQSFSALPIQYIDLHIYAINGTNFNAALAMADVAHSWGKQVAISEAWDDKTRDNEVGVLSLTAKTARNAFSFWEPTDIAYLKSLIDYAQAKQLLFLSPFWAHYFSAYLDYNVYGTMPDNTVLTTSYTAANQATMVGAFTPTGMAWENYTIGVPDTQSPSAPPAPLAPMIGVTAAALSWSSAVDDVGIAGYKLYRDGNLITTTAYQNYVDTALTSGATYQYTLAAFDAAQNTSPLSSPLVVTTINTTPPTAPANLTITGATKNSVSLTWNPSYNIGGVAGYRILRGKTPSSLAILANTAAGTTYTDSRVGPNTTYYYEVEGYIASGLTGPAGNMASVTTLAH